MHIIVLDLGSESMCAFVGSTTDMLGFQEINLQNINNIVNWESTNQKDVEDNYSLLYEDNHLSKRFLNKIELLNDIAEVSKSDDHDEYWELNDAHADLNFEYGDNYNKSVFKYYHKGAGMNFLCNPKVANVKGIANLMSPIRGADDKPYLLAPSSLIKHLTVQVINNLVLNAPECRNIKPSETKIILTFPNVYSNTHANDILTFVREHSKIKDVGYLYESDASVFATIGLDTIQDHPYINSTDKDQIKKLADKIEATRNNSAVGESFDIISIDIGKGTSDLSLFRITKEEHSKRSITILARGGVAKAGNSLDYIFAKHIDQAINDFYKLKDFNKPISLINKYTADEIFQNELNEMVQKIAFHLKTNMKSISNTLVFNNGFSREVRSDYLRYEKKYEDFNLEKDTLFAQLCLLSDAISTLEDDETRKLEIIKEMPLYLCRSFFLNDVLFLHLPIAQFPNLKITKEINNYTALLGEELTRILRHNAEYRYKELNEDKLKFEKSKTFLIISGQAAQFEPLKHKIKRSMQSTFNLADNNIAATEGTFSKKICCIGSYLSSFLPAYSIVNSKELLIDYFIKEVGDHMINVPYREINANNYQFKFKLANAGNLWFSTILNREEYRIRRKGYQKNSFAGAIRTIDPSGREEYQLTYDKKNNCLRIHTDEIKLQSFGNQGQPEDIYDCVWPELLR